MRTLLVFIVTMMVLLGCGTHREVVGVSVDTAYVSRNRVDSVRLVDSVYLSVYTKGDTVYLTKNKVVYRDRIKTRVDTFYSCSTDTIYVEKENNRGGIVDKISEGVLTIIFLFLALLLLVRIMKK